MVKETEHTVALAPVAGLPNTLSMKHGLIQGFTYCLLFSPLKNTQESELACSLLGERSRKGEENQKLGK